MICAAFRRTQNKCERKKALIYRCLRHTGAMCPQCEPFAERLNFRAPADYVAFVRRLITQVGAGPMDVIYGDWLSIHENRRVIAILFSYDEVAVAVLRFRPKPRRSPCPQLAIIRQGTANITNRFCIRITEPSYCLLPVVLPANRRAALRANRPGGVGLQGRFWT